MDGHFKKIFYVLPVKNLGPIKHFKFQDLNVELDCQTSNHYDKDESFVIDIPKSKDHWVEGERGEEGYVSIGFTGYHKVTIRIIS